MRKCIPIFIILLLITTCKKDDVGKSSNADKCYELDPDFFNERWDGPERYVNYTHSFCPCISPNDKNLIAYRVRNTATQELNLVVRNLLTGQTRTLIRDNKMSRCPNWSKKNWILFENTIGEVFKIKSNGDSLQKILGEGHTLPLWSPEGDRFLTYAPFMRKSFLISEDGMHLDTFSFDWFYWNPFEKNVVAAYETNANKIELVKYNLSTNHSEKIVALQDVTGHNGIASSFIWANINTIIWNQDRYGIYASTLGGSTQKLRSTCKYMTYKSFNMFPNDQYFYSARTDYKYLNDTPWSETNIWRMSIDGKHVTKIDVN